MRNLEKNLKALANRRRLSILKYLKENREAPVAEIAHEISLSFKATSKHLGILAAVDIIESNKRSLQAFYRLSISQKSVVRSVLKLL